MKGSVKSKVLFVVSLLFGLMFVNAGLNKFLNYIPMPKNMPEKMVKAMNAFVEIVWLMPLVGIAEIIGGILIVIPYTRALGALIALPVMVGIVLTNLVQDTAGLPVALVLALSLFWVMYECREQYMPLLAKIKE